MKNASRKRMIGFGVAWLAAYALVLNVVLTSVLHAAALSPLTLALGHTLCINSGGSGIAGRDDADKSDKRIPVHCPVCVGNSSPVALPPSPSFIVARTPSPTEVILRAESLFVALARFTDNHARGPPRHI